MADLPAPVEPTPPRAVKRSHWWREVLIIAVFYGLYTLVRDIRGNKPVSVDQAFHNARRVIHVERWVGIFHEQGVQHFFLPATWLIRLCDDFYGTLHFIASIGVLVLLFFRYPTRYRQWRNTLAIVTGLALIGFMWFPLMPPRLLPPGYHFVDTLKTIGGLWDFSSGPVNDVSNQYAAMPSLHTAWSAWCAAAVFPLIRPRWGRALVLLYPCFTVFAITVTANHFFADAVAGLVLLGAAYLLARPLTRYLDRRAGTRERRAAPSADRNEPTPSAGETSPVSR